MQSSQRKNTTNFNFQAMRTTKQNEIDLFENYETLPENVKAILAKFNEAKDENYENCAKLIEDLEKIGYTCEYYLDATLFNLKKL